MDDTKRRLHLLRNLRCASSKVNTRVANLTYALEGYAKIYNHEENLATAIEEVSDTIIEYVDYAEESATAVKQYSLHMSNTTLHNLLERGWRVTCYEPYSSKLLSMLKRQEQVSISCLFSLLCMSSWSTWVDNDAVHDLKLEFMQILEEEL